MFRFFQARIFVRIGLAHSYIFHVLLPSRVLCPAHTTQWNVQKGFVGDGAGGSYGQVGALIALRQARRNLIKVHFK